MSDSRRNFLSFLRPKAFLEPSGGQQEQPPQTARSPIKPTRRDLLWFGGGGVAGAGGLMTGITVFEDEVDALANWLEKVGAPSEQEPSPDIAIPDDTYLLTRENLPRVYDRFEAAYNGMLALLYPHERGALPMPIPLVKGVQKGGDVGGVFVFPKFVAISQHVVDLDKAELMESVFGHELGHMLYFNNPDAAERISGINSPPATTILKQIQGRLRTIYPNDSAKREAVYDNFREELIADSIQARSTCKIGESIRYLKYNESRNPSSIVTAFIKDMHISVQDRKAIERNMNEVRNILISRALESEHPYADKRAEVMSNIAQRYCNMPQGTAQGR